MIKLTGKLLLLTISILFVISQVGFAEICITKISSTAEEGKCIDAFFTATVEWTDTTTQDVYYILKYSFNPDFTAGTDSIIVKGNSMRTNIDSLRVGVPYYLKITPIVSEHGTYGISSKIYEYLLSEKKIYHEPFLKKLLPARWLLVGFQKFTYLFSKKDYNLLNIYNESTIFGFFAFQVLALVALMGFLIIIPKAWLNLRAVNIFPYKKRKYFDDNGHLEYEYELDSIVELEKNDDNKKKFKKLVLNRLTRREYHGHKVDFLFSKIPNFDLFTNWFRNKRLSILNAAIPNKWINKWRIKNSYEVRLNNLPTYVFVRTAFEAGGISNSSDKNKTTIKEISEAMASRAQADYKRLRKSSSIDLLWGLAVTSPLLGLFGTVTGLSSSFDKIQGIGKQSDLIGILSTGIYEALWTTIFGLMLGIVFMLVYYYFDYKLTRIYQVWEQFYIDYITIFKMKVDVHLPLDENGE